MGHGAQPEPHGGDGGAEPARDRGRQRRGQHHRDRRRGHFRQGNASVAATINDAYLPEGEWHELPVFEGDQWSYVSIISATGAGSIAAQIVERQ
jgi:hypothetical protein